MNKLALFFFSFYRNPEQNPSYLKTPNPNNLLTERQLSFKTQSHSRLLLCENKKMVWFQCEDCGDNLKKPKLANHFNMCSASKVFSLSPPQTKTLIQIFGNKWSSFFRFQTFSPPFLSILLFSLRSMFDFSLEIQYS